MNTVTFELNLAEHWEEITAICERYPVKDSAYIYLCLVNIIEQDPFLGTVQECYSDLPAEIKDLLSPPAPEYDTCGKMI